MSLIAPDLRSVGVTSGACRLAFKPCTFVSADFFIVSFLASGSAMPERSAGYRYSSTRHTRACAAAPCSILAVLIARSFGVIEVQSEMTYRCNETTTLGPNPLDDGIAAASGFV